MATGRNLDRLRGTLLGLAIGDALGAAVEFEPPGSFPEVTGYRGGGPHGLAPGEWTDDTSMALALADSIAVGGWDLDDQAEHYLKWWKTGAYSVNDRVFDIGTTTVAALQRFQANGDARRSGDRSARASGNGSIASLAPVPIRYCYMFPNGLDDLIKRCMESSLPTYASAQCLSAYAYMGLVLCGLIHGLPREEVLSPDWQLEKRLHPTPRGRAGDAGQFPAEAAARHHWFGLRGQEPGGRPMGVPRRHRFSRGGAVSREHGR
jgi:ADP-ribosyl-[dinitrogen reductase] hydrolase